MSNLPEVSPKSFTISAMAVGYILISTLTSTEQSALGNWFMLVGQILCTNGSYQFNGEQDILNNKTPSTADMLNKTLNAIKEELENLKKYNP